MKTRFGQRAKPQMFTVLITDPDKGFNEPHSKGAYTMHDALVLLWASAITPNAPMAVQIRLPHDPPGNDNRHLLGKGLTLKDVPGELHDDVARWIAEDIFECMDAAREQDDMYRMNKML